MWSEMKENIVTKFEPQTHSHAYDAVVTWIEMIVGKWKRANGIPQMDIDDDLKWI